MRIWIVGFALGFGALGCGSQDDGGSSSNASGGMVGAGATGGHAGTGAEAGGGNTGSGGSVETGGTGGVAGSGGSAGEPGLGGAAGAPSDGGASNLGTGIPFGPFGLWTSSTSIEPVGTDAFSMSMGSVSASTIVKQIDAARSMKLTMTLAMTGGAHENYLTNGVFDLAKWKAKMDTYDTPDIKAAIAAGVKDGTIVGNSVMDEPNVHGLGDGNTWGPQGTMTKTKVDVLCDYVKKIFPTLPVGVAAAHDEFEPDNSYKVCEFNIDQYSYRKGDLGTWRDAGLAMAKRDGHAVLFSMNIINGGIQAAKGSNWTCPPDTTGGRGTYEPNCRMTPNQVRAVGKTLGVAGCAMTLWRYDDAFMADGANQMAFQDVADVLATQPRTACVRP